MAYPAWPVLCLRWPEEEWSNTLSPGLKNCHAKIPARLVVSTHPKNITQIWLFPQVGVKTINIWNHHLATDVTKIDTSNMGVPWPLPKPWQLHGSPGFVSPSCLSSYIAFLRGDHNDLRGAGLRLAGHDKCISHLWSYSRKCVYIYIYHFLTAW